MEVDATFKNGSKRLLIALLNAVKDFNKPNSLSLRFSSRGINARFACGPPMHPLQSIISFVLDNDEPAIDGAATPATGDNASAEGSLPLPPGLVTPSTSPTPGATPSSGTNGSSLAPPAPNKERSLSFSSASGFSGPAALSPGAKTGTAFAEFVCKSETVITVHPRTLCHQLELVDDSDQITIRGDKTEKGDVPIYELYFESTDHGRKVLYEMDAVPRVEPIPPVVTLPKYTFVVQIEAEEFRRTIAALHETSEKVLITGTKNSITFCATGPIGTLQVGLVQKPTPPNKIPRFRVLQFNSPIRLTFDSRFLRGFTIATPLSTYVTLSFGSPQTPLKVTYPVEVDAMADGNVRLASLSPVLPTPVTSPATGAPPAETPRAESPAHEDAKAAAAATLSTPAESPTKPTEAAGASDRVVVGRLEYFLLPERGAQA
ncbi:hypothetical protein HDU96_001508 [Phlyctochytrium bullatum]|nr:hypothetical protein HDU96_001508 [Phlyctochytrium bullatum]